MLKIKKAVIPAAGLGTRFLPITKVFPKELLPIGNKPAIQYVVEEAVASGIEEIIFVINPSKRVIRDYFEQIESLAKYTFVLQEEPKGLGHAILCAKETVGKEPFLVMLPDVIVDHAIPASKQLMEGCKAGENWGLLLERVTRERIGSYGVVGGKALTEGLFEIQRAVEKPSPSEAPSDMGILGRYLFFTEIFGLIEDSKPGALGEIQLTDAISALARKKSGQGIICQGKIFDVGTPEGLLKAENYFSKFEV